MSCFCSCQRKSVSFFPPFHSLFCQFSGSYNRVKLKFLWGLICKKHIYFPHHPNSKRQSRKPKKKKQINRIKWRLFARFPSWGECCVIENAPGRVPGGNVTVEHSLPWWMTAHSFSSEEPRFWSPEEDVLVFRWDSKPGSSPDMANMWSFCCLLPPKLAWCFAASAMAASSVCLKSGLWEGNPREHELGLSGYQSPN